MTDAESEIESPKDKSYRCRITPHQTINGPLATVQNVTFDPETGDLDVEADTPGDSEVTVEVLEERDGECVVVASMSTEEGEQESRQEESRDADQYVNERLDEAATALEDAICVSEDRDQRKALIDYYRGVVWVLGRDYGDSDDE